MKKTSDFEFNDLQGLLRFGYGGLTDTCFMLLDVVNVDMAREWLSTAPISSGIKASSLPDTAMQIAFSKEGLSALEISKTIIDGFLMNSFTAWLGVTIVLVGSEMLGIMRQNHGNGVTMRYRMSYCCFMPNKGVSMPGEKL